MIFDLAIIGGGINGAAIAADAALRGLSVILFEKDDIASKTSSASTKLIHGGLRYLEYGNFSMVRKSIQERQVLINIAPYLVSPYPFVLPYAPQMRPHWLIKAGLLLYDNLSRKNKLPKSRTIKRSKNLEYFSPLINSYNKGFLYYDCRTEDVRLTIANALQAKKYGAEIFTNSELIKASAHNKLWQLHVQTAEHSVKTWQARVVINASGPWALPLNQLLDIKNTAKISLVKGSHLLLPRLYQGEHAYLLQNSDKRVVFVIPYHGFSMVGTTDVMVAEDLNDVSISTDEINYLLQLVSKYFPQKISGADIIASWSGVRSLAFTETQKLHSLSRDYLFKFAEMPAPCITVYSGKLTTARKLAEEAVNALRPVFPNLKASTSKFTALPGSFLDEMSYFDYYKEAEEKYAWLDQKLLERLLKNYGTNTELILEDCQNIKDLGHYFGAGLYQVEVDYLIKNEWASKAEDILWRRTKLGLAFPQTCLSSLDTYLQGQGG